MNWLDLLVLLAVVATFVAGYRLGLLARVCSWLGLFAGLLLTTRHMETVLRTVGDPRRGDQALAMAVALFIGSWAGKAVGMAVGRGLHHRLPGWTLPRLDRAAGGAVGVLAIATILWLAVPILAVVPDWPAREVRASAVARLIHDRAPGPPAALTRLRKYVEAGSFPAVVSGLRTAIPGGPFPVSSDPAPERADKTPPTDLSAETRNGESKPLGGSRTSTDRARLGDVARSVVKVEAYACNRILDGTGFVAAADRILTNAHVVAGASRLWVVDADGNRLRATIEAFDPEADAALLAIDHAVGRPLPFAPSAPIRAAVGADTFGHPGGGPLRVEHGIVNREVTADGRDIFDRDAARRSVLVMSARLAPGDSGAPVMGSDGSVLGMAFAVAPDRPGTAYALTTRELRRFVRERPVGAVDRHRCIAA